MASMGFTKESIHKLMSLLDESEDIDEMTYIELSNAAKFLYEQTNGNKVLQNVTLTRSQGQWNIHRPAPMSSPRPAPMSAPRPVPVSAPVSAPMSAPRPAPRPVPMSAPLNSTMIGSSIRLCNIHKRKALMRQLQNIGFEIHDYIPNANTTEKEYIKLLVEICKSQGMIDNEIKLLYIMEKNNHINNVTIQNSNVELIASTRNMRYGLV